MWQFPFSEFKELENDRIRLRKLDKEKDVPAIFKLRSHELVLEYLDREPPADEAEISAFINLVLNGFSAYESINWGITLRGMDTVIGIIGYWKITKEHYRAEIGYTLHPDYWGKGIMNDAMKLVIPFAFEEMKIHSIEANINPANNRSKALLVKNGFVKEAYFRENYYAKGKFLDSEIYSLINKS